MIDGQSEERYRNFVANMADALVYQEAVYCEDGDIEDFIITEVNPVFTALVQQPSETLCRESIGKVLPQLEHEGFDWLSCCREVARTQDVQSLEAYSSSWERWLQIRVFWAGSGVIGTVLRDVSERYKASTLGQVVEFTTQLADQPMAHIDYQLVADTVRQLSGAKFAAINTYDEEFSTTRAFSGPTSLMEKAIRLSGFDIVGRSWPLLPARVRRIQKNRLVRFNSLYEAATGALSLPTATALSKAFGLGATFVMEISGDDQIVGDLIMFMGVGEELSNANEVELAAHHFASVLRRTCALKALRISEENYRSVTENSFDMICVLENGRFLYCNQSYRRVLGFSPEQLVGEPALALVHPQDRARAMDLFEKTSDDDVPSLLRLMNRQGDSRWVEHRVRRLPRQDSQPPRILINAEDVTLRKEAEELVQEKASEQELLLDSMESHVWHLTDPSTYGRVNRAHAEFFATCKEDMVHKPIARFRTEEDAARCVNSNERAFSGQGGTREEQVHDGKGQLRLLSVTKTPKRNQAGQIEYVVCTAEDITARRQAEMELERQLRFRRLVAEVAAGFVRITGEEYDRAIGEALRASGTYFDCDRVVLFAPDGPGYTVRSFEWVREGPSFLNRAGHQGTVEDLDRWWQHLEDRQPDSLARFGPSPVHEGLSLPPHGTWAVLPMVDDGQLRGCVVFQSEDDAREWTDEEKSSLQTIAEIMGSALVRSWWERRLKSLSDEYRRVFDGTQDAMFLVAVEEDGFFRFIRTNRSHQRLTGLSLDDMQGKSPEEVLGAESGAIIAGNYARCVRAKTPVSYEETLHLPVGERIWHTTLTPVLHQGHVRYIVGSSQDISDRKRVEEDLRQQLEFQSMVASISSQFVGLSSEDLDEGIVAALGQSGTLLDVDASVIFQWSDDGESLVNTHQWCAHERRGGGDRPSQWPLHRCSWLVEQMRRGNTVSLSGSTDVPGKARCERNFLMEQGIGAALFLPLVLSGQPAGFVGLLSAQERPWSEQQMTFSRLVSQLLSHALSRQEADARVRYLRYHDQLTGLHNRAFFDEQMQHLVGRDVYPLAFLAIDVDGLKVINDTLGHHQGDQLLRDVAQLLRQTVGQGAFVARVGGDEFGVVLPATDQTKGYQVVDKIQRATQAHEGHVPLSLSMGLAVALDNSMPLTAVFRRADDRMYRDKLLHKDTVKARLLDALTTALQGRGHATERHTQRLDRWAQQLAQELDLSAQQVATLSLLVSVHDLGEVGTPDELLVKPGPLTAEEWGIMRQHAERGYRIAMSLPGLDDVAELVLKHHERWDGKGYPLGLQGEEIPVQCRILAIVDAFDAMTQERPYRVAMTRDEALDELRRSSGTQFDPTLVEIFLSIMERGIDEPGACE